MQIGFLSTYSNILSVREGRAALLANNIANSDTPGYKAVDIPFEQSLGSQLIDPQAASTQLGSLTPEYRATNKVSLDGNDVSLDLERVEAAQNGETMIGASTFLHQSMADLVMALRPNPGGN
ncbi:MAG: flagellar biosynthesis protein FlgB [Rhodospirillales bacterium 20-58-10]|nr:MAG: flagellar biosynthesis protein FlgB [Rhodospirillales bacterium 20-58-10]